MNSKERRKSRREKQFRNITPSIIERKVEGASRTVEEMNDFCPYVYECKEPHCFDCFGRYKSCERYRMGTPRTRTDSPMLYEPKNT